MSTAFTIVKALLRTEKGVREVDQNKYLFSVQKSANKIQIKQAVEAIYKVKVRSVNTQIVPGKTKRVRYQAGLTPEWKKAFVTLADGHKIDLA